MHLDSPNTVPDVSREAEYGNKNNPSFFFVVSSSPFLQQYKINNSLKLFVGRKKFFQIWLSLPQSILGTRSFLQKKIELRQMSVQGLLPSNFVYFFGLLAPSLHLLSRQISFRFLWKFFFLCERQNKNSERQKVVKTPESERERYFDIDGRGVG